MTITAETGRAYVPFLREQLRAHGRGSGVPPVEQARGARRRVQPLRRCLLARCPSSSSTTTRMATLHKQFMGIAGPTDVLTFPIDDRRRRPRHIGRGDRLRPAGARGRRSCVESRREHELLLYALHGMLHLLGYDDRTARDFATMHRTEDDILTQLGFGPVFAAAVPSGSRRVSRDRPRRLDEPSAWSSSPSRPRRCCRCSSRR